MRKRDNVDLPFRYLQSQKRRRQWHSTPVLLPGKSHGQRSLVGCSPWGRQSQTQWSDFTFTFHFHALEKEMATHSSVLAWRIPGTGSLVGCCLWGHTESDMTEAMQQQQQQSQKISCIHWIFFYCFIVFVEYPFYECLSFSQVQYNCIFRLHNILGIGLFIFFFACSTCFMIILEKVFCVHLCMQIFQCFISVLT